ncbi:protein PSK SIMULATOR 1 [Amaranthus tricolor]|uniref:protein PSK SIMULATOR 1 n=1 Tax=Amaranthus tricolor TaxID=29722 RepID=UPI0025882A5C|nr:protein PSK SIMULATOR 1 [Amaranthus tricolor]
MGGEGVKESWFSSLWGSSRRNGSNSEKAVLGILAFEVATLMSKIVNLWNCLSDIQIERLKEDVVNSPGIVKLISNDENYLMNLAFAEIVETLWHAADSVSRLGKKCSNPIYHNLDRIFSSPLENSIELYGWEYKWKKMEKKAKKIERFVAATSQLHQEMEVLVEFEQTLRRMQYNPETNKVKLLEFQQKVIWQRQEVKNLRDMSPWSRTYDYIVQLLLRCLVTIFERLKFLVGINQVTFSDRNNTPAQHLTAGTLPRSRSFVQSSVYPSENHASIFYSGPLVRSSSLLGLPSRSKRASKKHQKQTHQHVHNQHKKFPFLITKRIAQSGPFKGCMVGGSHSSVVESCMPTTSSGPSSSAAIVSNHIDGNVSKPDPSCENLFTSGSNFFSQCISSNTPPCSLGSAALSLHYANIIILVEKLASSPHLIAPDARDDLYNMLTTSIKSMLRARLKLYTKSLASSSYNSALATEWSLAITRMLEWLSPLAHNTVRWHSERNYEKHHIISRGSLLLVQTLYFANQSKTEAAIIELLLGLNYLYRFGNVNEKVFLEASGTRVYDGYSIQTDTIACNA